MIPTVDQAVNYRLRFYHFRAQYHDFLRKKAKELAEKIIIDEIQERMRKEGFSEKIWKNTYIRSVITTKKKILINIVSEYFSDTGFDVALAREVGTKDHWIRPKTKLALSWITKGIRLFSKGHVVSGMKSLKIIETTIDEKHDTLVREFNSAYIVWLNQIFG